MRVLHCYRTYFPDTQGGAEEAIRQIMLSTHAQGVVNSLFALSAHPDPARIERAEGVIVRSRSWAAPASCDLGALSALRTFRRLVSDADIIHYHFPWPFADVLHKFRGARGKPAVMTYHSDIVRQRWLMRLYAPLMSSTLAAMSAVVATSPRYTETSAVLQNRVPPERLSVIPLGIFEPSYEQARAESRKVSLNERFDLRPQGYFLSLGVLRYYKGLTTLLAAARDAGLPIVIAGDGPMREALQQEAAAHLPPGLVRFTGRVSDAEKIALIEGCRAFVLPSHLRSEAFGMVLVEAAMLGRPMVSCEIGTGTTFVNVDGETGIVIAPENPPILALALRRFLDDAAFAAKCGRAARLRYEALFSGQALGAAYAALYERLAHGAA